MKLSVIIPAYRANRTIKSAVKSALRNLTNDSEVLVYLDGEDKQTFKMLNGIRDKRLRVIHELKNHGEYFARNVLVSESQGEFIANLDADDICLPGRFSKQVKHLEKSNVDFLFMNAIYYRPHRKILKLVPGPPTSITPKLSALALTLFNPLNNSTMMTSKHALVKIGEFKDCLAPDYELWLRAAAAGMKLEKMPRYGILYRLHPDQMTASLDWKQSHLQNSQIKNSKNALLRSLIDQNIIKNEDSSEVLGELMKSGISMKLEYYGTLNVLMNKY